MPEKKTIEKARKLKREHKAPTTQAGPFVEEEIEHVREGKHGARSTKQAIAIGLAKAREAGVDLPPPKTAKKSTRESAKRAAARFASRKPKSSKRAAAAKRALKREPHKAASKKALSQHARAVARRRTPSKKK